MPALKNHNGGLKYENYISFSKPYSATNQTKGNFIKINNKLSKKNQTNLQNCFCKNQLKS